ncbi:MAG: hypothetical protein ACI9WU_000725 [Myxococcota bacterium]|jgi:hypothetical protein
MIILECRADIDFHYHLLAHLDLGRDASNLYDPELPTTPWVAELRAAYELQWQWAPLSQAGPEAEALLPAIEAAAPPFMERWGADVMTHTLCVADADEQLLPRLSRLRKALYGEDKPPVLRLIHAPSLRHHGRGLTENKERIVATSLARDLEQALCTVFHEECHPISDPTVRTRSRRGRDTRADSAGFKRHKALEDAAVTLGRRVIQQTDPDLMNAYQTWCARYGYR